MFLFPNPLVNAVAALIPLAVGFVWYHPKTFAPAWMAASGTTEEKMRGSNMVIIFATVYFLSFIMSFTIDYLVIHQLSLFSIMAADSNHVMDAGSEAAKNYASIMEKYGSDFRTFKHGTFHGAVCGITFALPVLGIIAMFERKSAKYILIHAGYWVVSMALMGGVICAWT